MGAVVKFDNFFILFFDERTGHFVASRSDEDAKVRDTLYDAVEPLG